MSQHRGDDLVQKPCASCGEPVMIADADDLVPACSSECAIALMDAMEPAGERQHLDTIECWCDPAIGLVAETVILVHRE